MDKGFRTLIILLLPIAGPAFPMFFYASRLIQKRRFYAANWLQQAALTINAPAAFFILFHSF